MANASVPTVVAMVNGSDKTVVMLRMALADEGLSAVGGSPAAFGRDARQLLAFLERHDPAPIVYDVAPPDAENRHSFKRLRDVSRCGIAPSC